jgi:hypothetical protein
MNADDCQSRRFVLVVPTPQLRDDVSAIYSTISPKFNQDHPAL